MQTQLTVLDGAPECDAFLVEMNVDVDEHGSGIMTFTYVAEVDYLTAAEIYSLIETGRKAIESKGKQHDLGVAVQTSISLSDKATIPPQVDDLANFDFMDY